MANMSYCRFENAANDLRACERVMDQAENLTESEKEYRFRLIKLCVRIAADYGSEVEK
jgi:hypothetical protein